MLRKQGILYIPAVLVLVLTFTNLAAKIQGNRSQSLLQYALNCKRMNPKTNLPNVTTNLEPEQAYLHFQNIHTNLSMLRSCRMHHHAGYPGPWIENHWIQHFEYVQSVDPEEFSETFGPFIPIFAQWVDCWLGHGRSYPSSAIEVLKTLLRSDVLYATVSQAAKGLDLERYGIPNLDNIFVFSAGGYGDVPIPLIKGELTVLEEEKIPVDDRKYLFSFAGTPRGIRKFMIAQAKKSSEQNNFKMKVYHGSQWRAVMSLSKTSFAPRGVGRTAFTLAEIIQFGHVPIYVYDDIPWIPYRDIFEEKVGYVVQFKNVSNFTAWFSQTISSRDIERRENELLKLVKSHFEYSGVIHQIQLFFQHGVDGEDCSDLRCERRPASVRNCGQGKHQIHC